jgi:hypothetical protein
MRFNPDREAKIMSDVQSSKELTRPQELISSFMGNNFAEEIRDADTTIQTPECRCEIVWHNIPRAKSFSRRSVSKSIRVLYLFPSPCA